MLGDPTALILHVQALTRLLPDGFWASMTLLGHGAVAFACIALAWRYRLDWLMAGVCAAPVAGLISRLLKIAFALPRPAAIVSQEQLHVVGDRLMAGSFPSGHTTTGFVLAGVILLSGKVPARVAIPAVLIAAGVGISRMAVGAHWPADVMAGAACGWFSAACGVALARRLRWLYLKRVQMVLALMIFISSASLLVINTGYPEGKLFQYFCACIGMVSAARWLRAECK